MQKRRPTYIPADMHTCTQCKHEICLTTDLELLNLLRPSLSTLAAMAFCNFGLVYRTWACFGPHEQWTCNTQVLWCPTTGSLCIPSLKWLILHLLPSSTCKDHLCLSSTDGLELGITYQYIPCPPKVWWDPLEQRFDTQTVLKGVPWIVCSSFKTCIFTSCLQNKIFFAKRSQTL